MNLRLCAKCERTLQESEGVKAGRSWYHVGCAANTWIRPRVHEFSEGPLTDLLKPEEKR
jgi:hypothetical protein